MAPFEVLTYAIDPSAVTGTGEISVHLIVKNQSESWVSNLCLKLFPTGDGLQILGSDTVSGITLKPYTSARLPLRFRARPGEFQIRLHSISLRLDGRSERFSEVLLDFRVVKPAVDLSQVSSVPATAKSRSDNRKPVFDVFLCYNSADRPAVKRIAHQLRQAGILPWFDEWESRPGQPWQRQLEQQISTIRASAVFVGPAGVGPWQEQEIWGFLQEFSKRNLPIIPVVLPNAPSVPKVPVLLGAMTWVDFRIDDPHPLQRLIWGITGKRPDDLL
jgi:hypothetical protein